MKILAFAFAAGEFLDEELGEIESIHGEIGFITRGEPKINTESQHPYEWWAYQEDVDELKSLK
jgi:hypothetical protein